jgi:hypothetical protein
VGGHGHHRHVPARPPLLHAQGRGGRQAVHLRHLHVHEDHVERALAGGAQRLQRQAAVPHHHHGVPALLQDAGRHLLVDGVVFRQQHAQGPLHHRWRPTLGGLHRLLPAQHRLHRLQQVRLLDRLGEEAGNPQLPAARTIAGASGGGEEDHGKAAQRGIGLHRLGKHEPVLVRHLPVGEQKLVRLAGALRVLERGQGLVRPRGRGRPHPPARQHLVQDAPVGGVVVHHQDRHPGEVHPSPGGGGRRRRAVRQLEARREVEGAPLSHLADHAELPSHHLHELSGDGQAQSGPSEAAGGGGVGLGEGREDLLALLLGDADAGVHHREAQAHVVLAPGGHLGFQHHLSLLRELDGVSHQVHHYLAEAAGVPQDGLGHLRGDAAGQLQALLPGAHGQHLDRVLHRLPHVHLQVIQLELPRLDAGEVEDVVHQVQERARGDLHGGQVAALLGREVSGQRQVGHPHDGVHGGADLVAHVGEEVRLDPSGLLGAAARHVQLLHQEGEAGAFSSSA